MYMEAVPELLQLACERAERNLTTGRREMKPNLLSIHLQRFFTERPCRPTPGQLPHGGKLSRYVPAAAEVRRRSTRTGTDESASRRHRCGAGRAIPELCRNHTRKQRRSRNTRLSAIRSFFKYVAIHEPQLLHHCQKILAMPSKRYEKRTIDFLKPRRNRSTCRGARSADLVRTS